MGSFHAGIVQRPVRMICNHLILSSNQSIGLAGEWNGVPFQPHTLEIAGSVSPPGSVGAPASQGCPLDNRTLCPQYCRMARQGRQHLHKVRYAGSNPASATKCPIRTLFRFQIVVYYVSVIEKACRILAEGHITIIRRRK